ncbi:hypothetical protein KL930_004550 [Ogataea haglerorum]|uniref:Endoplasmic reticulum lectin n=1 Tax=Ogataea haglerorum TaxID=1937702 RepID=A0AAN6HZ79_9ASCO|nr:uncharacterized protein KL911_005355 [Ogataea haglerorum]KAG7691678.1 hypothetical protein KL951_005307 [Ogataea haglerorum]KAG7692466.1 hypothetical protein KL915_004513 [Ogataea haglerorum]KAG7724279.1 hypothetical protein KL948_005333 [Ogataea haglerorum]KAG7725194.1 hypothetical protein KL933_004208 [Ogataea haglerorum]KAG7735812.1 hypothetical protein KL923_005328 [Ogataea haglerorum]
MAPNSTGPSGASSSVKFKHLDQIYSCHFVGNVDQKDLSSTESSYQSDLESTVATLWSLGDTYTKQNKMKCLYQSSSDYWKYCFCLDGNITQFRGFKKLFGASTDTSLIDPEKPFFSLGSFENANKKDYTNFNLVSNYDGPIYLEQTIGGGDICDKTGKQRLSTIRYRCDETYSGAKLLSVREIKTCRYEVQVYLPEICSSPLFKSRPSKREQVICEAQYTAASLKPENILDIKSVNLIPLGYSIFLGLDETNPDRPNVLVTNKRVPDISTSDIVHELLGDAANAFANLISKSLIFHPHQTEPGRYVSGKDSFTYTTSVFGVGGIHLFDMMILQDDRGKIVAQLISDGATPKNFIEFNGVEL